MKRRLADLVCLVVYFIMCTILAHGYLLAFDDLATEREREAAKRRELQISIDLGEINEDDLEEGVSLLDDSTPSVTHEVE